MNYKESFSSMKNVGVKVFDLFASDLKQLSKTINIQVGEDAKTDVVQSNKSQTSNQIEELFVLGGRYFQEGQYEKAQNSYEEILNIEQHDASIKGAAFYYLALVYLQIDKLEEAKNALSTSEHIVNNSNDKNIKRMSAFILSAQAFCLYRSNEPQKLVSQKYEKAINIIRNSPIDACLQIELANILFQLALVKAEDGNYKDAKTRLEEALSIIDNVELNISIKFDYIVPFVNIRRLLALFQIYEKNYFLAEKYYLEANEALVYSNLPTHIRQKVDVLFETGLFYYQIQRYQEAERYYEQALEYNKQIQGSSMLNVLASYNQILCAMELNQDAVVEKKSRSTLQLLENEEEESPERIQLFADIFLILAIACKNQGKFVESKAACQSALDRYLGIYGLDPNNQLRYQIAFQLKFELESQKVDSSVRDSLRQEFEKAARFSTDGSQLVTALENYATRLCQEKKTDEAYNVCIRTLGILNATNRFKFVPRAYKTLAEVCFQGNRLQDAQKYCQKAQDDFCEQGIENTEIEEMALRINAKLNLERSHESSCVDFLQSVEKCVKENKKELAVRYCRLAIQSYEQSCAEFQTQRSSEIALCYLSLGEYQRERNLQQEAQDSFVKFSERLKESDNLSIKDLVRVTSAYFFLASRNSVQDNEQRALNFFGLLDVETQKQFLKDAATTSRLLADQLRETQQYDKALKQYELAQDLNNKLEEIAPNFVQKENLASILNVIGALYYRQREYKQAKSSYKKAWKISKSLVDVQVSDAIFAPLHNLIFLYESERQLGKVQERCEDALRTLESSINANTYNVLKQRAIILNKLCSIVYRTGNASYASILNKQASEIACQLRHTDEEPNVYQHILLESSSLLEKVVNDAQNKSSKTDLTTYLYAPKNSILRSYCVSFLRTEDFVSIAPTTKQIKRFEKAYKLWLENQIKIISMNYPNSQLTILTSLTNLYERSILNITSRYSKDLNEVSVVVVLPMERTVLRKIPQYNYRQFNQDLNQATNVVVLPLTRLNQKTSAQTDIEDELTNPQITWRRASQLDYLSYYLAQQSFVFLHWNGKKLKRASEKIKNEYFESLFRSETPRSPVQQDVDVLNDNI